MVQVEFKGNTAVQDLRFAVDPGTLDLVRGLIWTWILQNGEKKVTLKFWFINKTFKLSDLHKIFEIVLGPKPVTV